MINSRLYKLRQEYLSDLQSRLEEAYSCEKCSKKEVSFHIYKEKRTWEVKATCSCGCAAVYSEQAEFRGYVVAQYKYILKSSNPNIKIKFLKETASPILRPKRIKKEIKKEIPKQHFFKESNHNKKD